MKSAVSALQNFPGGFFCVGWVNDEGSGISFGDKVLFQDCGIVDR